MPKTDNLQGSLELLIMKLLRGGAQHGFAISARIQEISEEVLKVEAGSLYPAVHRMSEAGLLTAEWRMSEAGRRARFYGLTAKGRRRLEGVRRGCQGAWDRMIGDCHGSLVQDQENISR